jgi:hypothetical protein
MLAVGDLQTHLYKYCITLTALPHLNFQNFHFKNQNTFKYLKRSFIFNKRKVSLSEILNLFFVFKKKPHLINHWPSSLVKGWQEFHLHTTGFELKTFCDPKVPYTRLYQWAITRGKFKHFRLADTLQVTKGQKWFYFLLISKICSNFMHLILFYSCAILVWLGFNLM